jgi:hypothetical protein
VAGAGRDAHRRARRTGPRQIPNDPTDKESPVMTTRTAVPAALAAAFLAAAAAAQPIVDQNFEGPDLGGWTVNGNQMLFGDDREGVYMGVPYSDFWGIILRNDTPRTPVLGDLSRYGGALRVRVDIRTFRLDNFFGEPMNPDWFPVVLQLHDYDGGSVPASVYTVGPGMPQIIDGWQVFDFTIPDPTAAALPPGWGGTGDEDPVTFEPRLPPDRTYASVLAGVDEFAISTFVPGYFYSSSFWQAGFDNILIERLGGPSCDPDVNQDGNVDQDDVAYLINVVGGGPNPTGIDPDFNHDGNADQDDIAALINVVAGGNCP